MGLGLGLLPVLSYYYKDYYYYWNVFDNGWNWKYADVSLS